MLKVNLNSVIGAYSKPYTLSTQENTFLNKYAYLEYQPSLSCHLIFPSFRKNIAFGII